MKRTLVVLLAIFMATSLFASVRLPFNHNATLIPANSSLVSGGFDVFFNQLMVEYTQGLKGTNIHGKIAVGNRAFIMEGLLHHHLFEWNKINMGFSYGGQYHFQKYYISEIAPAILWNMSHKFNDQIDFYGGTEFKLNFGLKYDYNDNTGAIGYNKFQLAPDWNIYFGTQIDIAKNLEVYIELAPSFIGAGSNAYVGVNYYISKGLKVVK